MLLVISSSAICMGVSTTSSGIPVVVLIIVFKCSPYAICNRHHCLILLVLGIVLRVVSSHVNHISILLLLFSSRNFLHDRVHVHF